MKMLALYFFYLFLGNLQVKPSADGFPLSACCWCHHVSSAGLHTLLHEGNWLDVPALSEGFPGNIWINVWGFIVLLTRTNTNTHTLVLSGLSLWAWQQVAVKGQTGSCKQKVVSSVIAEQFKTLNFKKINNITKHFFMKSNQVVIW